MERNDYNGRYGNDYQPHKRPNMPPPLKRVINDCNIGASFDWYSSGIGFSVASLFWGVCFHLWGG